MNTQIQTRWLRTDSPEWPEVLARIDHDFYHLPGYLEMSARAEDGSATAFCAEHESALFFLPLILRSIPGSNSLQDVICPYGYAGPLVKAEPDVASDFTSEALRLLVRELRERRVVSAFFRLNPLVTCPLEALAQEGCVQTSGATVAIDLSQSLEEMWRQTRSGHRNDILRARKNGFIVEMASYEELLGEFREIYYQTMRRVDADARYIFPLEYFLDLRAALGDGLHLCTVRIEGRVAAAALFAEVNGIVQYHLSGVHDDFVSRHPTKALLDYVRSWARERGNRFLHLGGGLGGRRDSLFDFKAGFSDLHLPFSTWRVVIDSVAYACLADQWEQAAKVAPDDLEGFFPAYRKPIPEGSISS